jgi:hypothetical protein
MSDRRELVKYLRFQLSELSAENGHHTFEHICREVARARIASNLLPATGPVSAGGDGGRDFETFRSYLPKELGEHNAFVARMSEHSLAFACTLQKDQVGRKFAKDIATIVASGEKFDHIYAMCVANVTTGSRNKLRNKIRDAHGVELTVFDGQWLADQLADSDLFWVAATYLSVPAAMAPRASVAAATDANWYLSSLKKWQDRGELRPTLGDLLDAKDGLRHATTDESARSDLDFWLNLLRPLTAPKHPLHVRQRARYEYIVATVEGTGELGAADDLVRAFFDDVASDEDAGRLKDASVLLNFAVTAYGRNITELDAAYLRGINDSLRAHLRAMLDDDPYPTQRAHILEVVGYLGLAPDPLQFTPLQTPRPVQRSDYLDEDGNVKAAPSRDKQAELGVVAEDEGMAAWLELVRQIKDVPLFPVEGLSMLLNLLAPVLVDHAGWRELIAGVDEAVRRSSGNAAAAESARDRAIALLNADRLRDGLDELHAAKVNWWTGDSIGDSLQAMLLIAEIYSRLNMPQASRQYALAVSVMAIATGNDELRTFVPDGLFAAAQADYLSGAWCSAVDLLELGFLAAHTLSDDLDFGDDELRSAVRMLATILRWSETLAPELLGDIRAVMRRCGLESLIEVSEDMPSTTVAEAVEYADEELYGRPFSDAGDERVIRFSGLGLDWTVRAQNTYEHVLVAERFAAAAQVLLVELASEDLCLLRTAIEVRVAPSLGSGSVSAEGSNNGRVWTATLMPVPEAVVAGTGNVPAHDMELLAVLSTILVDASLLPFETYMAELDDAFTRGLSHKLGSGRPYDELASVVSRDRFERFGRRQVSAPADASAHPGREHQELAWQSGPGPTYARATAEQMLKTRYDTFAQNLRVTLPRLLLDPGFRALVAELRAEGWKDWHILVAVFSRTLSLRLTAAGYTQQDLTKRAVNEKFTELSRRPEDPSWPSPPATLYPREDLVFARQVAMLKLVEYWDLHMRQKTPDFPAIERFLADRYAYWADDIEHDDPFPQVTRPPQPRAAAAKKPRARRS